MSEETRYLIIFILSAIAIIFGIINVSRKIKSEQKNDLEKENEELKKILYRNKDYEAKGIEEYQGSEIDRINRIAQRLDLPEQQELLRYAERLEKMKKRE